MTILKFTKQTSINFCLLATVLLLAVSAVSAQVTIGGVTISKPKRPNAPKAEKPAPKDDATGNKSETKTDAPTKPEAANTPAATKPPQEDFRLGVFLDDIKKAKGEVERYAPGQFYYLVSAGDSSAALLRAVSLKAREEWAKEWLKTPTAR